MHENKYFVGCRVLQFNYLQTGYWDTYQNKDCKVMDQLKYFTLQYVCIQEKKIIYVWKYNKNY